MAETEGKMQAMTESFVTGNIELNNQSHQDQLIKLFRLLKNVQAPAEIAKGEVDMYIINKVREMREESEMTQAALSQALNMADSFVSNVESLKRRDKYNVNHLNQLAKIFKCSPRDFLPEKPL